MDTKLDADSEVMCYTGSCPYEKVVHLLGQGDLEDDDQAPFRVVSGGGSDLARINCSLRHDTAYKPHEVCVLRLFMDECFPGTN